MNNHSAQDTGEIWPGPETKGHAPALVSGDVPCGTAWDFGASDCILAVKPENGIELLGDASNTRGMAFAFWVRKDNSDRSADYQRVFGWAPAVDCHAVQGNLAFSTPGIPVGTSPPLNSVVNLFYNAGQANEVLDGAWHHVVFSADFSSSGLNVAVFIDGQESSVGSVNFAAVRDFSPGKFFIIGGPLNAGNRWTGEIGRFQAWNRPLEAAEVATLFVGWPPE